MPGKRTIGVQGRDPPAFAQIAREKLHPRIWREEIKPMEPRELGTLGESAHRGLCAPPATFLFEVTAK